MNFNDITRALYKPNPNPDKLVRGDPNPDLFVRGVAVRPQGDVLVCNACNNIISVIMTVTVLLLCCYCAAI